MTEDAETRFTRLKDVYASHRGYVCYLGLERDTGVQVFWYEFVNEGMSTEDQQQKFHRLVEAKQIVSPCLLKIIDVFLEEVPPRFIVITEATQSPSIADYLHTLQSPLGLRALLKWFRLLCSAVQALHQAGVVHGAITPYCTFVKPTAGTLKLRLPLARLSGRLIPSSTLDLDAYKAPETLDGTVTSASDVWSLGVILLELVTGRAAFSELKTPFELVLALRGRQLPASLATVEPPELAELIRSCLVEAERRPTVEALLKHDLLKAQSSPDAAHANGRGGTTAEKFPYRVGKETGAPPA
jgi:serine/threonine protein kinase